MTVPRPDPDKAAIALDLEFEQPNRDPDVTDSHAATPTIIQVGWVVFDPLSNPDDPHVLSVRREHVHYGAPLSTFIKGLTGISDEDVRTGRLIGDVYRDLCREREFHRASRVVAQWGFGDMESLEDAVYLAQAGEPLPEWPFGRSGLNVKHMFRSYALANGLSPQCGLSKAVGRLGMIWKGGPKHRADTDAFNTARAWMKMLQVMKNDGRPCGKAQT